MIVSIVGPAESGKTLYALEMAKQMRIQGQSVTFISCDRRGPRMSQVPTGAATIFCYLDEIVAACALEVDEGTDLIVVDEVPAPLARSIMAVLSQAPVSALVVARPSPGLFTYLMASDTLLLAMPEKNPVWVDEDDWAEAFVQAMISD